VARGRIGEQHGVAPRLVGGGRGPDAPCMRPFLIGQNRRSGEEVLVSTVRQLYQLQLVDSEWEERSQRLALVEERLGESGDLIRAREAVVETKDSLSALRAQLRALELDVAAVAAKLKQNQDRLYGGRVRNPKELSNLQDEAAALRRRRSELEDEQLELMITIEEEEAELAERQARLRQIETSWRDDQASLQAEKGELEQRLAELGEERDGMQARSGAADLALYDDLCQGQGGIAVARLRRGICQACGVDVPTSMARAVERGEVMHYCPICNRLLFGG
jgi:predicted  nucleic acid-binding Zn-ribbon protein